MTPQHCDHECVCNWWACNVNCDILNDPCRRKNCEHDTRSRPLSDEKPCDHCDFNERDLQMAESIMKAKKAERVRVVKELQEWFSQPMQQLVNSLQVQEKLKSLQGEP